MGAWGTGIFSDDFASDLKSEFRNHIGDGKTSEEATDLLLNEYSQEVNDYDNKSVFWLSLAATQWNCGRLIEKVKTKAIEIIDKEADLKKWEYDPKLFKRRREVLLKLKKQLLSSQPPVKKIPRHIKSFTDLEIGDVISYKTLADKFILFRVIGYHEDKGGKFAVTELLDWYGSKIPSLNEINKLNIKIKEQFAISPFKFPPLKQFLLEGMQKRYFPKERVNLIAKHSKPVEQNPSGFTILMWKYINEQLKKDFNID